jgi:hypothetical protein
MGMCMVTVDITTKQREMPGMVVGGLNGWGIGQS